MKYFVGQIIYVLAAESNKIFPLQISEEVTRKKVSGLKVSYMVTLPQKDIRSVPIDKVKGQLFNSVEEIKLHLKKNAERAIDKMVDNAEKIANTYFVKEETKPEESDNIDSLIDDSKTKNEEDESVEEEETRPTSQTITLPNGQIAKVNIKMPPEQL
jgi:hypothetical protein